MAELEVLQFWTEPEDRDGKLNVWSTCKIDGLWFPGKSDIDDPGVCKAFPRSRRVLDREKLKSHGRSTTRLLYHGYLAADVEIEVEIWTIEQYRAYLAFLPKIDPARKITKTTKTSKIVIAQGPPAPVESVIVDSSGRPVSRSSGTQSQAIYTVTTSDTPTTTVTETKTTDEIPAHSIDHPDLAALSIRHLYFYEVPTPDPPEDGGVRRVVLKATEITKPASGNKVVSKPIASVGERLNNDADVLPEFKLDTGPRT